MVTFDVINTGDEEQKDVFVVISNPDLGISERIEVGDIGDFDKKEFSVNLEMPEDAEEKTYQLQFDVYDEDGDQYENEEEDKARFLRTFKILGICGVSEPEITASLDSIPTVGKELTITATIKNNDKESEYVISIDGYDSWASLNKIEPQIVTIDKDSTKTITITLTPLESGTHSFVLKAYHEGQTASKTISVENIKGKSSGFTGAFAGLGNTGLYVIAVVFLVLIIIIVVLIIKVSSGPRAEEF